ncbi:hypothetical protein ACFL0W_04870 [Nanoarchaeota archaeon]
MAEQEPLTALVAWEQPGAGAYKKMLNEIGYQVELAYTPEEAIGKLTNKPKQPFTICIVDAEMSGTFDSRISHLKTMYNSFVETGGEKFVALVTNNELLGKISEEGIPCARDYHLEFNIYDWLGV